jgi:DnaK suppressor protein
VTVPEPKAAPPLLANSALAKVDSGLTRKELGEFREVLLQRRAQLVGDVTTMRNEALSVNRQDAAGDLSNMPLHMADVGTDNYEQEFTLGLIESERQILREIDDALVRIKSGTFGVCAATGQPIGRARLRATPWAKYCYDYVLAQERGRRPKV